jgi:TonB-linked SusC/RagA family outer membrane protein
MLVRNYIIKVVTVTAIAGFMTTVQAQDPVADTVVVRITDNRKGLPVSGTITDAATKKGILGIRIQVTDYSAAITDSNGRYTLNVPSYSATVFVEGEGYDTRRVPLKGRKTLDLALLDDAYESFDEPVVLPLGVYSKKYVTAAVGQYKVNPWTQPGEIPDALLQGRIAGLNAIRRSGSPGAGANLFLRGYNSLYATNKPLIIVDGMLFDANDYGESIIANNYTNPLALIDVKDIDNITVLKDASSIYGTKGANGAIIITTARTTDEATKIDFAAYGGYNLAPKPLPVMKAADYRRYLSEILQSKGMSSSGIAAQPYMNDDPSNPEYARYHYNTNWQKKVLGNSFNQNYYLKVTGGDNIATYGLTLGYLHSEGVIKNTDLTRYNTRFNAVFNFTKKFKGLANLSFTYNEQNLRDQGMSDKTAPLFAALVKAPFLTDREVNDKGIESPNLADRDTLGFSNPAVLINGMQAANKYYRFFGSFGFQYDINEYFTASTLFGLQYDKVRETFFIPRKGVADDTLSNAIADSRMGSQVKRLFTIYNDTRIEFKRTYNRLHNVAARLGLRYQDNKAEQDFTLGFNSATDDLVSVQSGLPALRQVGGGVGGWNWMNIYFGAEYGYKEKLFLTLNAAVDGSSRFGTDAPHGIAFNGRKFPVMPSVGAAWLLSSENFMANSSISLLKLRATFSITGNDDIGNYSTRYTYGSQNLLGAQGLVRTGISNPALQWETSSKLNGGADIAFWNERVSLSIDAYHNETDNMLVYEPLTSITGFTSVLANNGKMRTRGIDASLNVRVINQAHFRWDAGLNIASYRNKILTVPGGEFTTEYAGATILTREGAPANQFYGYTTNGVFITDAEATASGLMKKRFDGTLVPFQGGDMRFTDRDNNKLIDNNDRTVIGNPNPDLFGGFTNRIGWNRFEFSALFTFSLNNDVYNYIRHRLESASGLENQLQRVNNRWRADGQVTNMPKATWGDPMGNNRFSDRWIEDGSFFRLRTLSIQYNLKIRNDIFLKNVAVYAAGNNLFTLTRYLGYDPEFSATPSLFGQGIDTGLDPLFRSVTLGIKIGL